MGEQASTWELVAASALGLAGFAFVGATLAIDGKRKQNPIPFRPGDAPETESIIAEVAHRHGFDAEPIVDRASAHRVADVLAQSPASFASGGASMAVEYAARAARSLGFGETVKAKEYAHLAMGEDVMYEVWTERVNKKTGEVVRYQLEAAFLNQAYAEGYATELHQESGERVGVYRYDWTTSARTPIVSKNPTKAPKQSLPKEAKLKKMQIAVLKDTIAQGHIVHGVSPDGVLMSVGPYTYAGGRKAYSVIVGNRSYSSDSSWDAAAMFVATNVGGQKYVLEDVAEPFTLYEFAKDNVELNKEELAAIGKLNVGESHLGGGGAGAEWKITRTA